MSCLVIILDGQGTRTYRNIMEMATHVHEVSSKLFFSFSIWSENEATLVFSVVLTRNDKIIRYHSMQNVT